MVSVGDFHHGTSANKRKSDWLSVVEQLSQGDRWLMDEISFPIVIGKGVVPGGWWERCVVRLFFFSRRSTFFFLAEIERSRSIARRPPASAESMAPMKMRSHFFNEKKMSDRIGTRSLRWTRKANAGFRCSRLLCRIKCQLRSVHVENLDESPL